MRLAISSGESRRTSAPALDAKGLPAARKKQPQVIVNFRGGGDSGARVPRGVFLPDGDGRRNSRDFVHIRLFHALEELARIGGEGFHIAPLAFGVHGVKRQRRFARPADAGDHGQGIMRNLDRDVLQVVHTGAPDKKKPLVA